LLNEFLKEHRKVEEQSRKIQEQDATIRQFKKEMQTIAARLKEQDPENPESKCAARNASDTGTNRG